MDKFRCRASAIGKIMTMPRSKKDREAGLLSKTSETYVKDWLKGQPEYFNRKRQIQSKYTYKGNKVEDDSIQFIADFLGYPFLFKNDQWYENEYIHGTPDVIPSDCVIDAKNSWDYHTFPYFETEIPDKDYWWQGQGYMWLTGRTKYKLVYTLMNMPQEQIYDEAKKECYANHLDLDLHMDDVYEQKELEYTYDDLPIQRRIKIFEFDRDESAIELIKDRVEASRRFIDTLITNHKTTIKI